MQCLIIDDKYNVHHAYPLCVEERLDYYEHMWDNDDEDNKMRFSSHGDMRQVLHYHPPIAYSISPPEK